MSYESDDKMVSHPDHYNSGKFEVIDIIEEFTKDLSGIEAVDTGNAIKYVLRWHKKNGVQDIKKAIWYLTHLAEHLEEKENPSKPHSVIIHKLTNGHYAIEDIKDDEKIDKEESDLSVECHTNAAGVTVPDSQPWGTPGFKREDVTYVNPDKNNCATCRHGVANDSEGLSYAPCIGSDQNHEAHWCASWERRCTRKHRNRKLEKENKACPCWDCKHFFKEGMGHCTIHPDCYGDCTCDDYKEE